LWQRADNGQSFKAALESQGYVLARGDRRDFVVIDRGGDDHSLARRLGVKAAKLRERMADIDRADLPSVAEAKVLQRDREAERAPHEPEQDVEPAQGARSRYDALRETEQEVAHDQFAGKYDALKAATPLPEIVQQFEASARRITEPVTPVYDRDAENADWEARLTEAAIAAEGSTRPEPKPEREGGAEAGLSTDAAPSESAPEIPPERENSAGAPDIGADAPSGLKNPERIASAILNGVAKAITNVLSGILGFLEPAAPKLSPQQAKQEAKANEAERVDAEIARESDERDAAFQTALNQIRRADTERRMQNHIQHGTSIDRPAELDPDGPERGGGRDRD
jgi:hypothetical protein